jgi:hypothetical protein
MTSQHDSLERLVRSALGRSTEAGLVVLDRPELSLAEVRAGASFFKCVDHRSSLYRLTPAAYDLAAARNWDGAGLPEGGSAGVERPPEQVDDAAG